MMAVRTATCKHVAQGDQACARVSAPFEASVCHLCGLLQLLFRLLLLQVQLLPRPPRREDRVRRWANPSGGGGLPGDERAPLGIVMRGGGAQSICVGHLHPTMLPRCLGGGVTNIVLFRLRLLQVQLLPRPPREGLERLVSGLLELPRPPRAGLERLVSGLLDRPLGQLIQQGRNEIMRIGIW